MGFYLLGGSLKRILEEQPPYPTHLLVRTLHSGGNFSKSQNLMNFANFPARVWVQGPGTTRAPTAQGGTPPPQQPRERGAGGEAVPGRHHGGERVGKRQRRALPRPALPRQPGPGTSPARGMREPRWRLRAGSLPRAQGCCGSSSQRGEGYGAELKTAGKLEGSEHVWRSSSERMAAEQGSSCWGRICAEAAKRASPELTFRVRKKKVSKSKRPERFGEKNLPRCSQRRM